MSPTGPGLTPKAWRDALSLIALMYRARKSDRPTTAQDRALLQRMVNAVPAADLDLAYSLLVDMLVDEIAGIRGVDPANVLNERLRTLAGVNPLDM